MVVAHLGWGEIVFCGGGRRITPPVIDDRSGSYEDVSPPLGVYKGGGQTLGLPREKVSSI